MTNLQEFMQWFNTDFIYRKDYRADFVEDWFGNEIHLTSLNNFGIIGDRALILLSLKASSLRLELNILSKDNKPVIHLS